MLVNLSNLNCKYIECYREFSNTKEIPKISDESIQNLDISEEAIIDFNNRKVSPNTIKEIYKLGDFLQINNWEKEILKWTVPGLIYPKLENLEIPQIIQIQWAYLDLPFNKKEEDICPTSEYANHLFIFDYS